MKFETSVKAFQKDLLKWYSSSHRKLPWRDTKDPYFIWLSEIILQQTRVEQGLPYYERFSTTYPNVKDLAKASEEAILKLWQGLGYYSRGRNLRKTAQVIMRDYNGYFPNTKTELEKLPGIGDYTASAIASFAYDESCAVLDGNVFRVLARIFNEDKPINLSDARTYYKKLLAQIFDAKNPAIFNQAIMEMGALICTPKKPNCTNCPAKSLCIAKQENKQPDLPVKIKAKAKRKRFFNFIILKNKDGQYAFQERIAKDIWQGLHHPFLIESATEDFPETQLQEKINHLDIRNSSEIRKHILSHQLLHIRFIELNQGSINYDESIIWRTFEEIKNIGKPVPIVNYFEENI